MKKIFYFFAILISFSVFAQSGKQPLVIIDGMLASKKLIDQDTKNVAKTNIYKSNSTLPQELKNFESFAVDGLISVKAKEMYYDRIALEGLNNDFKLPANNPVYFDGKRIENTKLNVIANAIVNMEVQIIDGNKYLSLATVSTTPSTNAIR